MTRKRGYFAFALALATVTLCASPIAQVQQQEPSPTFRTSADVVRIDAAVRRDKRPVTGLTADDFEVLDNGVPQQVSDLSYERLPIDVTIVLDVSASVTGAVLDQLRLAIHQLKGDLTTRDRLKLVAFNMRVRRLSDFAAPAAATDEAFASLTGRGSSAIFDSLAVSLATPSPEGRRHLIVLFSDGQDSSSITDPDALFDVARRTTPTVAVVLASSVPTNPVSMFSRSADRRPISIARMYDQLGRETGGQVVSLTAGDNLTSTFRRVLAEFRASYVLYYTPRGVDRSGTHTLDVRVKREGTEVRARRGYVWQ